MIRRPPRSTQGVSSAASDVYKRQVFDQHIPLYQGHVPSITSENINAKSFARYTKTAIEARRPKGFDVPNTDKYRTIYNKSYSVKKNRRFYAEPETVGVARDLNDYHNLGGDIEPRPHNTSTLKLSIPIAEREHRAGLYDFSSTKSKWVNRDMSQNEGFARLSTGFQHAVMGPQKAVVLPIAGYGGFMPGHHALNMHGKAFREIAVQSRRFAALTQKSSSQMCTLTSHYQKKKKKKKKKKSTLR
eukprot:TRINITY_DN12274_c0_g1_i2.p1 TRINITY_DN12274_c0_g1~~TRINITY_DN12274_c0_g1_i2.p1  ORF type:complete len:244 (+),score=42.79 TRINITY_DN12274_c0_g1_i2:129-860(+)